LENSKTKQILTAAPGLLLTAVATVAAEITKPTALCCPHARFEASAEITQKSGTGHRDAVTFTPFGQFRIKTAGWGWASAPTAWHGLRPSGFGTGGTTAQD